MTEHLYFVNAFIIRLIISFYSLQNIPLYFNSIRDTISI